MKQPTMNVHTHSPRDAEEEEVAFCEWVIGRHTEFKEETKKQKYENNKKKKQQPKGEWHERQELVKETYRNIIHFSCELNKR